MTTEMKTIEKIRASYGEKQSTKFDELKALDRRVKRPAKIFAYTFGAVSSLVLGTGMCLAMKVIFDAMFIGVGIGLVGIGMVSINYPIYRRILKRRKNKFGEEILKLCSEIENS